MPRIRLIHWNQEEAAEKAALLRSAGYEVEAGPLDQAGIRLLRADPPAAVVIDLTRLPAQGRIDLILWFVRSRRELERRLARVGERTWSALRFTRRD